MKSTPNQKRLLLIGIIIILIFVLVIFLKNQTDTPFKQIQLSSNNTVFNETDVSYIDTIVSTGLDKLQIKDAVVIIKPITDDIIQKLRQSESTLEFKAFIIGKNGQYNIYITNLPRHLNLEVLSHELIHLQQTEDNQLIKGTKNIMWKGIEYSPEVPYNDRPWEIDAYKRQSILLNEIKNSLY